MFAVTSISDIGPYMLHDQSTHDPTNIGNVYMVVWYENYTPHIVINHVYIQIWSNLVCKKLFPGDRYILEVHMLKRGEGMYNPKP